MRKVFTLLLFVSFGVAHGQVTNYTKLAGPYGGSPNKIISGSTSSNLIGIIPGTGIVISSDGGTNWSVSNGVITNLNPADIYRDASSGKIYALYYSQLYSSPDDGVTWSLVANTGFTTGLFIRKSSSYFFIVGSNRVVYRSLTGTSWTSPSGNTPFTNAGGGVRAFEINSSNGYLFIAYEGSDASLNMNGVYRSTNNGLGFEHQGSTQGLTNGWVRSLVYKSSSSTMYALTEVGPFKTTNNGTNWTSALGDNTETYFDWFSDIAVDPSGNLWILDSPNLWKSANEGVNWISVPDPMGGTFYADLRGYFFSSASQFLLGVGSEYIAKTTNGGANWSSSSTGLTAYNAQDLKMTSSGRILISKGRGITLSIDDGASWDELNTDPLDRNFYGIKMAGTALFGFGDRLVKSIDLGNNWTTVADRGCYRLITNDGVTFYNFDYDNSSNPALFAIERSADGGVTWSPSDKHAIPTMPASDMAYYPTNDNFFVTNSGSVLAFIYDYHDGVDQNRIYKVNPANGDAVEITIPTGAIQDIDYQNGRLYVSTNVGMLYISPDDGATWTGKSVPMSGGFARVHAINDNTIYYTYKLTLLTIDGGDTWSSSATFPGLVKDVFVSSANYAYVLTEYAGIYKSNAQVIPPTAPSTLVSYGKDRNSIGILWNDNSTTEDYFLIEASEGNNTSYDSVATATRPNSWSRPQGVFVLSSINGAALKSNTTYFIRVRAVGSGGTSGPTNEVSVTTTVDCTASSSFPQNRSWTATTLNTSGVGIMTALNQTLTGSSGQYTIQDLPLGANVGLSPTPPNPYAVAFEENCGAVFLSGPDIYLSNGNGTWDGVTNTLTIPWMTNPQYPLRTETTRYVLNAVDPAPAAPSDFTAILYLPGQILLNWSSGAFTQQFELERSLTSGSGFALIATVNFPSISYKDVDPTLVPGTVYYYRVRAKNNAGNSGYSSEVNIIPRTNYRFMPMDNLPGKTFSRPGGGGTWGDVDGDGIHDLVLPMVADSTNLNELAPQIFKSQGNGQFTRLLIPELVSEVSASRCINIVDVNNDGLNDIHVSRSVTYDVLLIKQPNGTYTKSQIVDPLITKGITSSSYADYDKDGDLDLVITGRANPAAPETFLYNNDGTGAMTRITAGELVEDLSFPGDANWADYDNDGDQDILVVNQGSGGIPSRLYQNNGNGTFTRVLGSAFENAGSITSRSPSWGDYDNDGFLDVFISSLNAANSKLFRNLGDGSFSEVVGSTVADAAVVNAYGSGWADLDNDMDLDLIVSGASPAIYYNNGNGTFTKYATQEFANAPNLNKFYGVAFNDVDNDGFLDFLYGGFSNPDIPNSIFRNTTTSTASTKWLKVNLVGTVSNRSAIGARLILTAGGKTQIREVSSHTSHSSASTTTQHFGMAGNATATTLVIKWPSGIIQTLNNVAANQTLTITEDGTGPTFTLLPTDNATNVSTATKLEITVNEMSTAVGGKMIKLVRSNNPGLTVFQADVTTATKTGNTYSFTLPAKLWRSASHDVTLDAGAFVDIYGNPSLAIASGEWNFITGSGPVLTARVPETSVTNVPLNSNLELTFDRAITAVAGKKITILDGATVLTNLDVATNGTIATNKYALSHPGPDWPSLTSIEILLDSGAFVDANQDNFGGFTSGQWVFTTALPPDVTKPVLTVDPSPLNILDKGFSPINFGIEATDDRGVNGVTFYHRKVSVKDFTATGAVRNPLSGTFELQVLNSFADEMGFEYYVEATDDAGNVARTPDAADQYFRSLTQFASASPTISVPGGGAAQSWKIIAIPFTVASTQIAQIFADLGTASPTSWRMLRYQHSPQKWLEFPTNFNTIERGQGYFINAIEARTISLTDPTAPTNTRDNLFTINLIAGWNLIGNPYTVTVNWDDVITYNNASSKVLKLTLFTNGSYTENPELLSGVGGFVFANEAVTGLQIPFKGQTSGGRVASGLGYGDLGSGSWLTRLTLTQGEVSTDFAGVGMSPEASNSFDGQDGINPPRFMNYAEVNFSHPEHFAGAFARDVVTTKDEYTWSFEVSSNQDGLATLTWDNSTFGNNAKELYLMDVTLQHPVNMRTSGSYSFDPNHSSEFKIFYGEDLDKKVKPSMVLLGSAFPNPTAGSATIPFTLPDTNPSYDVQLDVFDLMGRKVGTLVKDTLTPGFYRTEWTAQEELTNGVYVYRLSVSCGAKAEVLSDKLILKR